MRKCAFSTVFHVSQVVGSRYLTIIGAFEQIILIYQWLADQLFRLREIIDLQDTDKSRYLVITEFNNCFTESFHISVTLWQLKKAICNFSHNYARGDLFVGSYLQVTWWVPCQWKRRKKSMKSWLFFLAKVSQVWNAKKMLLRKTAIF